MDIFPQINGTIEAFDVIVIGHLKWNPYFGESAENPPRGNPSTCTSVMIRGREENGKPYVLIVDPTLRNSREDYYFDINRRTGLNPGDVTHCFATHSHFDHQIGLSYFPHARWCAGETVALELKTSEYIDGSQVNGVTGEFLPGISTIALPGHMENLYGIAFEYDGNRFVAAGDGVMTKEHFRNSTTMFEKDAAQAAETIKDLKDSVDVVIPGHDNLILNRRERMVNPPNTGKYEERE